MCVLFNYLHGSLILENIGLKNSSQVKMLQACSASFSDAYAQFLNWLQIFKIKFHY